MLHGGKSFMLPLLLIRGSLATLCLIEAILRFFFLTKLHVV